MLVTSMLMTLLYSNPAVQQCFYIGVNLLPYTLETFRAGESSIQVAMHASATILGRLLVL